ncbi:MAG: DUF1572 family protein [Bacteroidota bacterium]
MVMLSSILATLYERDLRKLIEEVNLFNDEEHLWRTHGSMKNSSGNLVLHIIGGMNHFFGATLARTGYVRNRDQEFARKGIKREELVKELEELIPMMTKTIGALSQEQLDADFPLQFDNMQTSTSYVVVRLLAHLNYHLGQINYLRRTLE